MALRPAVLAAVLTLTRFGLQFDEPEKFKPSRFADWDKMVRLPMVATGLIDPGSLFSEGLKSSEEANAKIATAYNLKVRSYVPSGTGTPLPSESTPW